MADTEGVGRARQEMRRVLSEKMRECVVQGKGLQPPEDGSGTPAELYVSSVIR